MWIILFGSHARGTYVDNPVNGYISDYDILVAVNGRELADDLKFWYGIEDKINRLIRSPINSCYGEDTKFRRIKRHKRCWRPVWRKVHKEKLGDPADLPIVNSNS